MTGMFNEKWKAALAGAALCGLLGPSLALMLSAIELTRPFSFREAARIVVIAATGWIFAFLSRSCSVGVGKRWRRAASELSAEVPLHCCNAPSSDARHGSRKCCACGDHLRCLVLDSKRQPISCRPRGFGMPTPRSSDGHDLRAPLAVAVSRNRGRG
jgi:hypothetical protein